MIRLWIEWLLLWLYEAAIRRGASGRFGEILDAPGKDKDGKFMRRMAVWNMLRRHPDAELLIKSNITKYSKRIADSFVTDLGSSDRANRDRILLAGRLFENEYILREMERAKEFWKTGDEEEPVDNDTLDAEK